MSRKKYRKKTKPAETVSPAATWANPWDRYWFGPVAAIRPYLLLKAVLLLLAFDMWMLRVDNGALYGSFGFNVAHFHWLDAIQPVPTQELYIGLALSVGILALVCTLAGASRWMLVLLALGYSYSWMMSIFDNFQHHYFLSLVLFAMIFFPLSKAADLYPNGSQILIDPNKAPEKGYAALQPAGSWSYRMLGANIAIVYLYTAVTKISETEYLQGEVVRRVTRKQYLLPFESWLANVNIVPDAFYQAAALGVIFLEVLLPVAYLLAVFLDEKPRRWLRVVSWSGFLGVLVFHFIGNEIIATLRIGWFSYYMIVLACIYLLPASLLWAVGWLVTWPIRFLGAQWRRLPRAFTERGGISIGSTAVVGLMLSAGVTAAGYSLDLPGGIEVGLLAALTIAGTTLVGLVGRGHLNALKYGVATALATILMWVAITESMVRFEFYELAGAQKQAQGDVDAAIKDMEKAIRYVPQRRRNKLTSTKAQTPQQVGDGQKRSTSAP